MGAREHQRARPSHRAMHLICKFTVPVPPSSKNARRARVLPGGRIMQYRPRHVLDATHSIQVAAQQAMQGGSMAVDDEVCVRMLHDVAADVLHVRVYNMAPRARGRTGRKRDVVNMPELVLDALQGIAFTNDRQVGWLTVARKLP